MQILPDGFRSKFPNAEKWSAIAGVVSAIVGVLTWQAQRASDAEQRAINAEQRLAAANEKASKFDDAKIEATKIANEALELLMESKAGWMGFEVTEDVTKVQKAANLLQIAKMKDPDNSLLPYISAMTYLATRDYKSALPIAEKLVSEVPESANMWSMLGSIKAGLNDYGGCLDAVQKAANLTPMNPGMQFRAAEAAARNKEWDLAEHRLSRVVQEKPNDALAWATYAFILVGKGDFSEAKRKLRQFQQVSDPSPRASMVAGLGFIAVGLGDEALEAHAHADTDPAISRSPLHNLMYGKLLYLSGDYEKASLKLEAHVGANPKDVDAMEMLLNCYYRLGTKEGIGELRRRIDVETWSAGMLPNDLSMDRFGGPGPSQKRGVFEVKFRKTR